MAPGPLTTTDMAATINIMGAQHSIALWAIIFFDTPCTLDHSCRFVLTRHMEAQDFSDFFEHINPDAPEILSMPSYCDLLRDLQPQAHAHG